MADSASEKNVTDLVQALQSEDATVRRKAADALRRIADPEALEPLIQASKDEDWITRAEIVNAIAAIGGATAVEHLIQALEDSIEIVRGVAARGLINLRDQRAVEPLIRALKDEDFGVRLSAAEALGAIADTKSIIPLTKALLDGDPRVRMAAEKALEQVRAAKQPEKKGIRAVACGGDSTAESKKTAQVLLYCFSCSGPAHSVDLTKRYKRTEDGKDYVESSEGTCYRCTCTLCGTDRYQPKEGIDKELKASGGESRALKGFLRFIKGR